MPLARRGVAQVIAWLKEEFDSHSREEIESKLGFFTTEPYTPPKEESGEAEKNSKRERPGRDAPFCCLKRITRF